MRLFLFAMCLGLLAAVGCVTQKQRTYITVTEADNTVTRIYCTQRNTSVAVVGEAREFHQMDGACGTFAGDSKNIGVNEEGGKALLGVADVVSKNARPGGQLESGVTDLLEKDE